MCPSLGYRKRRVQWLESAMFLFKKAVIIALCFDEKKLADEKGSQVLGFPLAWCLFLNGREHKRDPADIVLSLASFFLLAT